MGRGDDGPAALVPDRECREFVFEVEEVSGGGVGDTESLGKEEFNSCRGRLFAAAVSSGGGWGRSLPVEAVPCGL